MHHAGTSGASQEGDQEGGYLQKAASNIAANTSMSIMERNSKNWVRVSHKIAQTHVLCARASVKGYTST